MAIIRCKCAIFFFFSFLNLYNFWTSIFFIMHNSISMCGSFLSLRQKNLVGFDTFVFKNVDTQVNTIWKENESCVQQCKANKNVFDEHFQSLRIDEKSLNEWMKWKKERKKRRTICANKHLHRSTFWLNVPFPQFLMTYFVVVVWFFFFSMLKYETNSMLWRAYEEERLRNKKNSACTTWYHNKSTERLYTNWSMNANQLNKLQF